MQDCHIRCSVTEQYMNVLRERERERQTPTYPPLLQATSSPPRLNRSYGLWSKLLCKLSSLSDLNNLPHAWHTNVWAILALGLALSPLSVVGPMLEADILLITPLVAVLNLSVTVCF